MQMHETLYSYIRHDYINDPLSHSFSLNCHCAPEVVFAVKSPWHDVIMLDEPFVQHFER
jgi:hypothetical protein